jgi:1,4-dihydroxy-2-naphthoyl-CoA hydrolase
VSALLPEPVLPSLPEMDDSLAGVFLQSVGLKYDSVSATEVLAHLELTPAHHSPRGIVHGGVWATVIESVGGTGATYAVAHLGQFCVGVNNQADFLRPVVSGRVDVRATAVSQGRTLQLWHVTMTDARGKLVAAGHVRLFNQALPVNNDLAPEGNA